MIYLLKFVFETSSSLTPLLLVDASMKVSITLVIHASNLMIRTLDVEPACIEKFLAFR